MKKGCGGPLKFSTSSTYLSTRYYPNHIFILISFVQEGDDPLLCFVVPSLTYMAVSYHPFFVYQIFAWPVSIVVRIPGLNSCVSTAFFTSPRFFSKANSGECTPMMTSPESEYLSCHWF